MTWEVRAQFSRVNPELGSGECEWNAVLVESQEEAEAWWNCRTMGRRVVRTVHTMLNPEGEVVRVMFQ